MVKHDFIKVTIFLRFGEGTTWYHLNGHQHETDTEESCPDTEEMDDCRIYKRLGTCSSVTELLEASPASRELVVTDVADANRTCLRLITQKKAGHQPTSTTVYNDKLLLTVVNNHSSIFHSNGHQQSFASTNHYQQFLAILR